MRRMGRLRAWLRYMQCMAEYGRAPAPWDSARHWAPEQAALQQYWIDQALRALHRGGWSWTQGEWGPYWFKRLLRRLCLLLPRVELR